MRHRALLWLVCLGCGGAKIHGVIEPLQGERPQTIPGPMPGFGPFDSFSDALIAACPLVMGMPHANAGRPSNPNFKLHWRLSREYCAWVYRTPENMFEMSMLTASPAQDDPDKRQCTLPPHVDDARYTQQQLGYVFVVHNHPAGTEFSMNDISFILEQGLLHGWTVKTNTREIPLAIIAFFSNEGAASASCGGFYQFTPVSGELVKWVVDKEGSWTYAPYGKVRYLGGLDYEIEKR